MDKGLIAIASKIAADNIAIRVLLQRMNVISDRHQHELVHEIRGELAYMPDNQEAKELRRLLMFVRTSTPKMVTTTLYGHA